MYLLVILILKMPISPFPIESGKAAFNAGVILQTALRGPSRRITPVLSGAYFIRPASSTSKGEFHRCSCARFSSEFNVHWKIKCIIKIM